MLGVLVCTHGVLPVYRLQAHCGSFRRASACHYGNVRDDRPAVPSGVKRGFVRARKYDGWPAPVLVRQNILQLMYTPSRRQVND